MGDGLQPGCCRAGPRNHHTRKVPRLAELAEAVPVHCRLFNSIPWPLPHKTPGTSS